MAEIEYFVRGKNKSIEDIEEDILYYVLEYFLALEFEKNNSEIYREYILPIFEKENYVKVVDEVYYRKNTFGSEFRDVDASKIPLELYKKNYTTYILNKYTDDINLILERIKELTDKSKTLYRTIYFGFLENKYFNKIPKEIYFILCNFPKIQNLILRMTDANYLIFINTIKRMTEEFSMMDIIIKLNTIIGFCNRQSVNLDDVNNINYDVLIKIMFNDFDINYELGMPSKDVNICDYYKKQTKDKIHSDDINEIIDAVLIVKYGLTFQQIKRIFENGNELLKDDLSSFLNFYKEVLEIVNMSKNELIALYDSTNTTILKNYYLSKKYMKNRNLKLYNDSLVQINKEMNEYELEDDFRMIIHVTGAFSNNDTENYYSSWNREQTTSLWMSCSYISNELICTAPLNNKSVCYGFNTMGEDSLLYYENSDLESETNSIEQRWVVDDSRNIPPNSMINNTGSQKKCNGYYNEMNFARMQNGRKKQPDYIIMFRNNNEYINEENSRRAQKEFGNIPIVIIDIDKMLKKSENKFILLCKEYVKTKNKDILQDLYTIVNNCRKTCFNWHKTNNFFLSEECQNFIDNYRNEFLNNEKEETNNKSIMF